MTNAEVKQKKSPLHLSVVPCVVSLQLYPDTVQYELAIEGRNHTIHLEKNRYTQYFKYICLHIVPFKILNKTCNMSNIRVF